MPSWSFLVVGGGISLLSLRQVLVGQKMGIFIVVGIAMLIYGIIRMVRERSARKAAETHEPLVHGGMHPQHPRHSVHGGGAGGAAGTSAVGAVHAHQIPRMCGTCSAKNNPRANYCGNCGNKIRE